MTDKQIIEALIARDESVTEQFFYGNCRPLFLSIIRNVFSYEVNYDEFVNEFYLFLMENNSYLLKEGDAVTARGFGKFTYVREVNVTKKDKVRILIEKYE